MTNKETCKLPAVFRYTWAGQDESFCCVEHGSQINFVAQKMGYHLQLILLLDYTEGIQCQSVGSVGESK